MANAKKLSDEEVQTRLDEKNEKARVRAEKKALKEASKLPKHQAKLDRAKLQLPVMDESLKQTFDDFVVSYEFSELETFASHLNFYVREKQTQNAVSTTVEVGQTVRIKSGNQKHLGKIGVVSRSQRIRCYVSLPNLEKEIYLFNSDVEPVSNDNEDVQSVDVDNAENDNLDVAVWTET